MLAALGAAAEADAQPFVAGHDLAVQVVPAGVAEEVDLHLLVPRQRPHRRRPLEPLVDDVAHRPGLRRECPVRP
jgi:hypothetical protein